MIIDHLSLANIHVKNMVRKKDAQVVLAINFGKFLNKMMN
jgi:hypothetical protein